MNLHALAEFIYEDLEARITAVHARDHGLDIDLECDDSKAGRRRAFRVECTGVVEARVTPTSFDFLAVPEEHVLLLDHIDDFGHLAFSSVPVVPEVVVARLYEAHRTVCGDWRPFSSYVNHFKKEGIVALLRGGMGMLAQGPYRILQAYEHSVSGLLETSLVRNHREQKLDARLLVLDSEYVIAQAFESNEKTP
jgi:hypothetical protein